MILLDTDVCVEILRKNEKLIHRIEQCDDELAISFLTVAELYYGAERSSNPKKNCDLIEEFLLTIPIIHSEVGILKKFGQLKARLYQENILLPDADIFIAATAYVKASKLITGNWRHFQRFPNLVVENWMTI